MYSVNSTYVRMYMYSISLSTIVLYSRDYQGIMAYHVLKTALR